MDSLQGSFWKMDFGDVEEKLCCVYGDDIDYALSPNARRDMVHMACVLSARTAEGCDRPSDNLQE
jgi:hypothetical protein